MRTILQSGYGEPERVLVQGESDIPTPGDGEVLVRVHATSVNTPDCIATLGVPYALRLVSGLRAPLSPVRGSDVAGVVEAVGAHVTGFAPGDAVFGSVWTGGYKRGAPGTFCEYTVVPAAQLAHKPAQLSFEEAAGAVMSGVTALVAMRDVARVRAGQQVLVNGASGGLGTFAVQIARALGARVTGVCSTRNVELVRSLGASHVIDYTRTSYPEQDARYDVVMDNVMNHPPSVSARVLTANGVLLPNSIGTHKWLGHDSIRPVTQEPRGHRRADSIGRREGRDRQDLSARARRPGRGAHGEQARARTDRDQRHVGNGEQASPLLCTGMELRYHERVLVPRST